MIRFFLFLSFFFFHAERGFIRFLENGKEGIQDEQGKIIVPARYDKVGWSDGTFSVYNHITGYKQNEKWGLLSIENKLITKPLYHKLKWANGHVVAELYEGIQPLTGVLDEQGKEQIPFHYRGITCWEKEALVWNIEKRKIVQGIVRYDGREIIPPQYADIQPLKNLFAVRDKNYWALFSTEGKSLTGFMYDSIVAMSRYVFCYHNGQFEPRRETGEPLTTNQFSRWKMANGKLMGLRSTEWTVADAQGKKIKTIQAEKLKPIGNSLAFSHGKKWGVWNEQGEEIYSEKFDTLLTLFNNTLLVEKQKTHLLDEYGNKKELSYYDDVRVSSSFFMVKKYGLWSALTASGDVAMPLVSDTPPLVLQTHFIVTRLNQYGVYHGGWIIPFQDFPIARVNDSVYVIKKLHRFFYYQTPQKFLFESPMLMQAIPSRGNFSVWTIFSDNELYGMKDAKGRIRIANRYEAIRPFQEKVAAVKLMKKWGFINEDDKLVIQPNYDSVSDFHYEQSMVWRNKKCGVLSRSGKEIFSIDYQDLREQANGWLIKKNDGWGWADKNGTWKIEPRYQSLQLLLSGDFLIQENNRYGILRADGEESMVAQYNTIFYHTIWRQYFAETKGQWVAVE